MKLGRGRFPEWGNQIIRYENIEAENLPLRRRAGRTAGVQGAAHPRRSTCTCRPRSSRPPAPAAPTVGFIENLTGLHVGKVALITGGSAGIGGAGGPTAGDGRREGDAGGASRKRAARRCARASSASWTTSATAGPSAGCGSCRVSTWAMLRHAQARGGRHAGRLRPHRLPDQQRRCVGRRGDGGRHEPGGVDRTRWTRTWCPTTR